MISFSSSKIKEWTSFLVSTTTERMRAMDEERKMKEKG